MNDEPILVAGAGGFIGGHLVKYLQQMGYTRIRAVDVKPFEEWYQRSTEAENLRLDLRERDACWHAARGMSQIYNLAADMGGMGFIEKNRALCMLSVLINTHLLMAAKDLGVQRYFYASSACVYAADKQKFTSVKPLREEDAYPAMPEDGYGWEKLFGERMCRHFYEDFGLETRVARFHNIYGPHGTWDGGREKAPAAISRKIALAVLTGNHTIEVWGDGKQIRSFTFIDDCLYGTTRLMASDVREPLNIGSSDMVSVDELIDIVEDIAGVRVKRIYDTSAPQGVRGRNSNNTLVQRLLGWSPSISLRNGLEKTYEWIYHEIVASNPILQTSPASLETSWGSLSKHLSAQRFGSIT